MKKKKTTAVGVPAKKTNNNPKDKKTNNYLGYKVLGAVVLGTTLGILRHYMANPKKGEKPAPSLMPKFIKKKSILNQQGRMVSLKFRPTLSTIC